ncbi:MAG TPA: DNA (cytosine-5-)-methyltransferase [Desulfobacterales bacterium]|nr:DNA (cytosine-5-)-methyltransferase [Desulfobacterales bacterium]
MNFGSLFSGIGGIDKGLEDSGMTCKWQVEIDDFYTKVLTKHWPDVPKFGDIRNVGKRELETVDLIAGGFPCQPFSTAGKQRGTKDNRHLWPEMLRVISELKPTWVLGENVSGIIPLFLDQAISDLEAEGYTIEAFVLPAVAFDAPHRRDRLFIIAYANSNCQSIKSINGNKRSGKLGTITDSTGSRCENTGKTRSILQGEYPKDKEQSGSRGNGIVERFDRWPPQPRILGVDDGIPYRMERVKGTSNAVVPQVAEHIGRMIMEANNEI